jgi:hypothetical protein
MYLAIFIYFIPLFIVISIYFAILKYMKRNVFIILGRRQCVLERTRRRRELNLIRRVLFLVCILFITGFSIRKLFLCNQYWSFTITEIWSSNKFYVYYIRTRNSHAICNNQRLLIFVHRHFVQKKTVKLRERIFSKLFEVFFSEHFYDLRMECRIEKDKICFEFYGAFTLKNH